MGGSDNRHLGLTILGPRNLKSGRWSTSYEGCGGGSVLGLSPWLEDGCLPLMILHIVFCV